MGSWRRLAPGPRFRSPPATRSRSSAPSAAGEGAMTHIAAADATDALVIAGRRFASRLLLGTGGYPNQPVTPASPPAAAPALAAGSLRPLTPPRHVRGGGGLVRGRDVLPPHT